MAMKPALGFPKKSLILSITSQVGLGGNISSSDALAELSDELRKPIVLIVDEAQHAIVTDRGYDALYALKTARDELNSSAHFGLLESSAKSKDVAQRALALQ